MTTIETSPAAANAVADQPDAERVDDHRFSSQYLLNLLLSVGTLLATVYDRRSALTRNQTRLITALLERDGQTQTELANALEIHKVSIGIYISELEAMDLVERRQHPTDRRAKCIYLTPRLHAAKHIGVNQYAAIHEIATHDINDKTYLAMLNCMEQMRENLMELDRKDRETGVTE